MSENVFLKLRSL